MSRLRILIALIVLGLAFPEMGKTTSMRSAAINVLDSDVDGDALTVSAVGNATNGIASINPDSTINFMPAAGSSGSDSFSYTISDDKGGTAGATVAINVTSHSPSASYVATKNAHGSPQNFEHDNCSKGFYHDGKWWAVLPGDLAGANGRWSIYELSKAVPGAAETGGWSLASGPLGNDNLGADIAWDPENENLYVLQFSANSPKPQLYQLSYEHKTQTWTTVLTVDLGENLDSSYWGNNKHLALGLDQYGNPLIFGITSNSHGGPGLQVAHPASINLDNWSFATIDAETVNNGGANGDSKADFVTFTQAGLKKIGILYSKDGANSNTWNLAWRNSQTNPSTYGSGWSIEVVANNVQIDNHVSATTDGKTIYAVIKDDNDSIWLLKGQPGNWEKPLLVVNGGKHSPSRPIVVLDETNQEIYVFYEAGKRKPYNGVFAKRTNIGKPAFNSNDLGAAILRIGDSSGRMSDPQGPAHAVGVNTDGHFVLFAKNKGTGDVWYKILYLGAKMGPT